MLLFIEWIARQWKGSSFLTLARARGLHKAPATVRTLQKGSNCSWSPSLLTISAQKSNYTTMNILDLTCNSSATVSIYSFRKNGLNNNSKWFKCCGSDNSSNMVISAGKYFHCTVYVQVWIICGWRISVFDCNKSAVRKCNGKKWGAAIPTTTVEIRTKWAVSFA